MSVTHTEWFVRNDRGAMTWVAGRSSAHRLAESWDRLVPRNAPHVVIKRTIVTTDEVAS